MPGMKDRDFIKPVWSGPGNKPVPDEMLSRLIDRFKQIKAGKRMKDIFFEEVKNKREHRQKKEKGGKNG